MYVKSDNTLGVSTSIANADTFYIDPVNQTMKSYKTGLYVQDNGSVVSPTNPPMVSTGYATNITWDGTKIKVGSKYLTYNDGVKIEALDNTKPNLLYNWTRET